MILFKAISRFTSRFLISDTNLCKMCLKIAPILELHAP